MPNPTAPLSLEELMNTPSEAELAEFLVTVRDTLSPDGYVLARRIMAAASRTRELLSPPRAEVRWFAQIMEEKLRQNDHKSHWGNAEPRYLLRRLGQELGELRRALARVHWPNPTPEQRGAVIREAADVANFAMMLADNAKEPPR